jgi:hypothetical protein
MPEITASARSRPWRAPPGRPSKATLRDPLRAAIAARDESQAALARHQQAITRAKERIGETTAALNRARTRTAEGKRRAGEGLALAMGGAVGTPSAMTQTRPSILEAHERVAADAAETALAALRHLEDTRVAAHDAVAAAEANVLTEINKLLAPLVSRLLDDGEKARQQFIRARSALRALSSQFSELPKFSDEQIGASIRAQTERDAPLGELKAEAEVAGRQGLFRDRTEELDHEYKLVSQVQQMRDALRRDPNAPLPTTI